MRPGIGRCVAVALSFALVAPLVAQTESITQNAYVKASTPHMGDHFGNGGPLAGDSVALSGDGLTLAVGAPQDSSTIYNAGAIYVFVRASQTAPWRQQAYLKASNPQDGAEFGHAISLSADGNTMAVAAQFESSGATGVNGNQHDSSVSQAGAVYVFTRRGGAWAQQAYIKASNTGEAGTADAFGDGDQFGFAVSLSDDGNTLAVGATAEDSNAAGINGNQADNSMASAGVVYLFARRGVAWSQQAYLKPANTTPNAQFGYSVGLSSDGSTLAVGSFDEPGATRQINGPDNAPRRPGGGGGSGAVYVFVRNGDRWAQDAYLKAANGENGDSLGVSVSISDDGRTIASGILDEDCTAAGVNPSAPCDADVQDDTSIGAVAIFEKRGAEWMQRAFIKASNPGNDDWFGARLQLSGDGRVLAVSAQLEDSAARGTNGPQDDNSAQEAGAVYLFSRTGDRWVQVAYLKSANDEAFDEFGSSLALSRDGTTLAVGARGEDSGARGINGDASDNSLKEAGAVYLFHYSPTR